MSDYYDLGKHSRPVTTTSAHAQVWFDRGLNWTYGFNHEEAVRCFERALEADPNCAMAWWGIAYASGPNYNRDWDVMEEDESARVVATGHEATARAMALRDGCTAAETGLISALLARYPSATPGSLEQMDVWNDDYADAMREVYLAYPDDLDIAALFAEALMTRTPWMLWNLVESRPADGTGTVEARGVLERALDQPAAREHPGVLHMYIHLMEMSPFPELALRAGDWLGPLVPDSGHLIHMPTHIDVLCGQYQNVVIRNHLAVEADRKFLEREGLLKPYTLYCVHNAHFEIYGAMFMGQFETAMAAADELERMIPHELIALEDPPMADRIEAFRPMRMHVYIRFGRWQDIIDTPLPEDQDLYCVTTATIHYAKSVAYSATGRIAEAEAERDRFEAALARVPESRRQFNNSALDILAIAREMLQGELEYRKGNYDVAWQHLRRSIELDDGLLYDEPWGWMQPTRHAYGALLLEQGHIEESAAVYRADLGLDGSLARAFQHPENVWALHGYHECLQRLGRHDEARMIKQRLDLALARSDTRIHASCFCRMNNAA